MSTAVHLDEMEAAAARIEAQAPGTHVEFTRFASGAGWLDVHLGKRLFILVYAPNDAIYGVEEVLEEDAFTRGYKHVFPDLDSAVTKLMSLVLDGRPTPGVNGTI